MLAEVPLGRMRGPADECRRYRPIKVTFDTRNTILDLAIKEDWEPSIKSMWEQNKTRILVGLVAELGVVEGDDKIKNYRAMGPEPWSIVFAHTRLLRQIRNAFAHGNSYPALVGSCTLGERLLHQLVHALRDDFKSHSATTRKVGSGNLGNSWRTLISVLHGWGVLSEPVADTYRTLEQLRHAAIHFEPELQAAEREPALTALLAIQEIVTHVFEPHGRPPRFIRDSGVYFARAAEDDPLVKRIFLPHCALVSPNHAMEPDEDRSGGWIVMDDVDYPEGPLSDEEFLTREKAATERQVASSRHG